MIGIEEHFINDNAFINDIFHNTFIINKVNRDITEISRIDIVSVRIFSILKSSLLFINTMKL